MSSVHLWVRSYILATSYNLGENDEISPFLGEIVFVSHKL